jgi:hypothetical protein
MGQDLTPEQQAAKARGEAMARAQKAASEAINNPDQPWKKDEQGHLYKEMSNGSRVYGTPRKGDKVEGDFNKYFIWAGLGIGAYLLLKG